MKKRSLFSGAVVLAASLLQTMGQSQGTPIFMSIVTNYSRITNQVIVTNYVVVTNVTFTTNFYNTQGQLLTLVPAGAVSALAGQPAKPSTPATVAPDPAVVRANKVKAIRELLSESLAGASNALATPGTFAATAPNHISIPEGVTVFDRRKGQTLTTALNAAAEQALPGACAAVATAIGQVDPPDPAPILNGPSDAATRYLTSTQGPSLTNQVLAVVQSAASEARVPEAYNAVMLRGGGLLGAVLGTAPALDINGYINRSLLDAIFLKMAAQEKVIRTDPTARKSQVLRDAFGG